MKIAVIGNGLIGLQAAIYFDLLEASVILVGPSDSGGELARLGTLFPEQMSPWTMEDLLLPAIASALTGLQDLAFLKPSKKLNYGEIQKLTDYLLHECQERKLFQAGNCTLIKKQTLSKQGPILGQKRLRDLFRIHFMCSPQKSLEESFEANKQLDETLPKALKDSLAQSFEAFLDVDIVLDARGKGKPLGMSFDGNLALGESLNTHPHIFYGLPGKKTWESMAATFKTRSGPWRFLIVGSGEQAALAFLCLGRLRAENSVAMKICITSQEKRLFGHVMDEARTEKNKSGLFLEIEKSLDDIHVEHQKNYEKHLLQLQAWNELEDYEQVKVPRPLPPGPMLNFFPESQIQSVDKLMDREEIYISYETSCWNEELVLDNKGPFTLPFDYVLVANKRFNDTRTTGSLRISEGEPGYYQLSDGHSFKKGLDNIKLAEQDLSKYFKRLVP